MVHRSCSKSACNAEKKYQDLTGWKQYSYEELLRKINSCCDNDEVRVYNVESTKLDITSNLIRHQGSGPNLEGNIATLTTCKRYMRRARETDYWEGKWILGVTSRAIKSGFNGKHYLLYLMKVKKAFLSHKDIFSYLKEYHEETLKIKNATTNRLGDIFEPIGNCNDALDPSNYLSPHPAHSHGYEIGEEWESDISYKASDMSRKSIPLLLGDIDNTFVWQKPTIMFNENRGSGSKILSMNGLRNLISNYII